MANPTRPRYKTTNIYSLMQAKGADEKVFHDPYRWSRGPRKADRILDVRGPAPIPIPVDRNAIVSGVFAVGRVGTVSVSGKATASVTGVTATGVVGDVIVVEPVDQFLLATGGVYGNPPGSGSTTLTPFRVYRQEASALTRLTDPPNQVDSGAWRDLAFSSDNSYLIGVKTDPAGSERGVIVYSRSGETFTKLDNPATLPAGNSFGCAASSDGTYFAVASQSSPFVQIYKRSGSTLTKLSNPSDLPPGAASGVCFSHDDTYLVVATGSSPNITIYKRSGDTITKLANPSTLPGAAYRVTFSQDDVYLYVSVTNGVKSIAIYKRSGDTFTKLTDPTDMSTTTGNSIAASPDGKFVGLGLSGSDRVWIYERDGDTFTKLPNPAYRPPVNSNVFGITFSPDSKYMALCSPQSPYVVLYSISGSTFTRTTPSGLPTTEQYGIAYSNVLTD